MYNGIEKDEYKAFRHQLIWVPLIGTNNVGY